MLTNQALSYKRNFCAKDIILGIAKKVIPNAVANDNRISMGKPNILSFQIVF